LGVRVPPSARGNKEILRFWFVDSQLVRKNRELRESKINQFIQRGAVQLESMAQLSQGKGWGSSSVNREVKAAATLLGNNPRLCVDVGGNLGNYTKALLAEFNTEVIVFEPNIKNYQLLLTLFSLNKSVKVEKLALSNKHGIATLFADENGSGLASLAKRKLEHFGISFDFEELVTTTRFEDYWRENLGSREIGLLKLDIEGHELSALQGFGEALNHIDLIQFEFGGCNIDTRTYFQDFWYFFKEHNFDIYRIGPLGLRKIERYSERDEFFSTTNYFSKKTD
jgi:FkbM family methyltransferase